MAPAEFNPYEAPRAELPQRKRVPRRSVTFGEVVIVAWIFSILVAIEVPLMYRTGPPLFDLIRNTRESVLIILALTVAPVLTIIHAIASLFTIRSM